MGRNYHTRRTRPGPGLVTSHRRTARARSYSEGMTDDLRAQAISSLKAKNHFWQILGGWVVLSALFTVIWLVTGGADSYFWPVWPILGVGIGVVAAAFSAFGPASRGMSEARIRSEMDRLGR